MTGPGPDRDQGACRGEDYKRPTGSRPADAGGPGFELWPALDNRFDPHGVHWRFEATTDVLGLDRERVRARTLGRALQNCLWEVGNGRPQAVDDLEIARRLRGR